MSIHRRSGRALAVLLLAVSLLFLNRCAMSPTAQPIVPTAQVAAPPQEAGSRGAGSTTAVDVDETEDERGLGYTDQRKIVRDSRGNLYIAYRKKDQAGGQSCYHIFVSKSTDNGAHWTVLNDNRPIERVDDCTQRVPDIAVDEHDVVHVAWYGKDPQHTGENDRQIKYARSTDGGQTWSDWINVGEVPGYDGQRLWQEHPTLWVSGTTIYIVWQGPDTTYPTAPQIKLARSTDSGQTWEAWRNVSPGRNNHSRPTLVASHDGSRLYLLAYGDVDGLQQIIWTSSTDGGTEWAPWAPVAPDLADQRHVSVVVDSRDHLHAVWRELGQSGTTQIEHAVYDGRSWGAPEAIAPVPAVYQFFPSIAVAGDDTLWVVWTETSNRSGAPEDDPTDGRVFYASKRKDGAWSARAPLPVAGASSLYASLRRGGSNNPGSVDVVWLEAADSSHWRIRYAALGT